MKTLSEIQKTIISVYAMVFVGALMMLIPMSLIPYAGLACMSVGFISSYVYKWKNKHDEIMTYHMGYIVRTTWWSSLILLIGVGIFCSILISNGDLSAITNLMSNANNGVIPTENDIMVMQITFVKSNLKLITFAGGLCLIPYPVYLIYRAINGVRKLINDGNR